MTNPGADERASAAGPGWYQPAEGPIRWWDGKRWSGSSLDDAGVPVLDVWVGHVTPLRCWLLAGYYLLFTALFGSFGVFALQTLGAPYLLFPAVAFLGPAVYWVMLAVRAGAIAKIPAPLSQPLLPPQVRPLPTDVEGPAAGWYPAPSRLQLRWWTGLRWSEYVVAQRRYLPTYGVSVIVRRNDRFMFWMVMVGLAALALGLVLLVLALVTGSAVLGWVAGGVLVMGAVTALVAGIARPLVNLQARRMGIPHHLPAGPPVQTAAPA